MAWMENVATIAARCLGGGLHMGAGDPGEPAGWRGWGLGWAHGVWGRASSRHGWVPRLWPCWEGAYGVWGCGSHRITPTPQPAVPCPPHAARHRDVPLPRAVAGRGPPGAQSHRQQRLQKQVGAPKNSGVSSKGPPQTPSHGPLCLTPSLPPAQHGGGGLRRGVRPGDVRQQEAHQQRLHDLRGAGRGGPAPHPAHGRAPAGGKEKNPHFVPKFVPTAV